MTENVNGPFIVWQNYGYEGWKPDSYPSLKDAVMAQKFCSEWVITEAINFDAITIEKLAADVLNLP